MSSRSKFSCEVENCCFCIDLRTGSMIIGYLSLIVNIILVAISTLGLVLGGLLLAQGNAGQTAGTLIIVIFCILLGITIINLIFNIVLLVGLHKYKRRNVKAYLIFGCVFVVINIIFIIVNICTGATFFIIMRDIASTMFNICCLIIIRSYYLKMDDSAKSPTI